MPKIKVTFKIEERVVTEVTAKLDVESEEELAELLADRSALRDRVGEDPDEWVDLIDPGAGAVTARGVIEILSATGDTKES
jgi:hypothetical protein